MSKSKQEQPAILNLEEIEKKEPERKGNPDGWIADLVGSFCDPIIVMPGGWGDTLPSWIKEAITIERLIENMGGLRSGQMTATDAEACAYLYTASLTAPMGHDWSQIYLYIAGKVYEKHRTPKSGVTMPADIKVDSLSQYQMGKLSDLKRFIYEARLKARKARRRDEGLKQISQEQEETETEVVQHAFKLD